MNRLIQNQVHSEVSRFCKIIRESTEFSREEMVRVEEAFDDDDVNEDDQCRVIDNVSQNDYELIKKDVLRILQRKIDEKLYI